MSSPTKPPESETSEVQETESIDRARRRLIGMAIYVPPTVLGIISLQQAGCQPGPTCGPQSCNPEVEQPGCGPPPGCNPEP